MASAYASLFVCVHVYQHTESFSSDILYRQCVAPAGNVEAQSIHLINATVWYDLSRCKQFWYCWRIFEAVVLARLRGWRLVAAVVSDLEWQSWNDLWIFPHQGTVHVRPWPIQVALYPFSPGLGIDKKRLKVHLQWMSFICGDLDCVSPTHQRCYSKWCYFFYRWLWRCCRKRGAIRQEGRSWGNWQERLIWWLDFKIAVMWYSWSTCLRMRNMLTWSVSCAEAVIWRRSSLWVPISSLLFISHQRQALLSDNLYQCSVQQWWWQYS